LIYFIELWKNQGKLFVNALEIECIFPDEAAPDDIEVHWAVSSSTKLIYRTDIQEKRMNNFWQTLPQLKEKYKELWETEDLPIILRSRFGSANKVCDSDQGQLSLEMFTNKTMIPTSLVITMLIWGIQRTRRPAEDVARTCRNFMALWSLTFSVINSSKCRVVRDDGARFAFMINPTAQVPFLECLFSKDYAQQIAADWKSMFSSKSCPEWMSFDNIYQASVLQVLMFMLLPCHGRAYNNVMPVVRMVIRSFATCVDKMGRAAKISQVAEKTIFKNRKAFSDTMNKRKAQCAQFLLRENDSYQQKIMQVSFWMFLV